MELTYNSNPFIRSSTTPNSSVFSKFVLLINMTGDFLHGLVLLMQIDIFMFCFCFCFHF